MPPLALTRAAIAAVWLYEGLWCKLLGGVPLQVDVVDSVPFFDRRLAEWILRAIGVAECGLAVWVLSGRNAYACALAQTVLLVGMNACGLLWARRIIHDPAGMVVKNFAFLLLAWVVAAQAAA